MHLMCLKSLNHAADLFLCLTLQQTLDKTAFFGENNWDIALQMDTAQEWPSFLGIISVSDTGAGSHVRDGGDRDDDDVVGDGY